MYPHKINMILGVRPILFLKTERKYKIKRKMVLRNIKNLESQ